MNKKLKQLILFSAWCASVVAGLSLTAGGGGTKENSQPTSDTAAASKKTEGKRDTAAADSAAVPYSTMMLSATGAAADTYSIQLGIYMSQKAAEAASAEVRGTLLDARITKVKDASGTVRYVLGAGTFASIEEAEKESSVLRSDFAIRNRIIRLPPAQKK